MKNTKTNINYYERVADLNNLYHSAQKYICSNVDWKYSVQQFEASLLPNLYSIYKKLKDENYNPSRNPHKFTIIERGKTRNISSPPISDKIVQKTLIEYVLKPILCPYLIYDNGASLENKGVGFSRKRLIKHLYTYYRNYGCEGYILIGDFSSYFKTIPHDKLIAALSKYIQDEKVMSLLEKLINIDGENGIGLGLGSEISQLLGVFYLTPFDNYIKIVKSCKYYGRHMDDFYIISQDKEFLKNILIELNKIAGELGLKLNSKKTQICKINKGFQFLKQFIFITDEGKIIRKPCMKNIQREKNKLKKFKKKMDEGMMNYEDIKLQYIGWRQANIIYNRKKAVKNVDKLFNKLFETNLSI